MATLPIIKEIVRPMKNMLTSDIPPAPALAPAPPAAPLPGATDAPEIEAAKAEEREKQAKKKSRFSTILTGPQGLAGTAPVQRKTLLGQ